MEEARCFAGFFLRKMDMLIKESIGGQFHV
jgi:hypothetical protein